MVRRVLIFRLTIGTVTATTLASSPSDPVYGEHVTLTATVTSTAGAPSGVVEFFDGATSLGTGSVDAGVATLVTTTLGVGDHSVTARYAAEGPYLPSTSSPGVVTVSPGATTTTVSSSANPAGRRQPVTLTASVGVTAQQMERRQGRSSSATIGSFWVRRQWSTGSPCCRSPS